MTESHQFYVRSQILNISLMNWLPLILWMPPVIIFTASSSPWLHAEKMPAFYKITSHNPPYLYYLSSWPTESDPGWCNYMYMKLLYLYIIACHTRASASSKWCIVVIVIFITAIHYNHFHCCQQNLQFISSSLTSSLSPSWTSSFISCLARSSLLSSFSSSMITSHLPTIMVSLVHWSVLGSRETFYSWVGI